MMNSKKGMRTLKSLPWWAIGITVLLLAFAILLLKNNLQNFQAMMSTGAHIYFEGEYRIDGGEWHPIEEGEHIPSTRGDVTLRGKFHMSSPDGEYIGIVGKGMPIAFFLDHVNVKIYEDGNQPFELYNENPSIGSSACGEIWLAYVLTSEKTSGPMEIVIHNPHHFGNETAVDDFLSGVSFWTGADFEGSALASGETQRNIGLVFCIGALVLLSIALFSTLLHIQKSRIIWMFGLVTIFAGLYLTYSASGTYFWSERIEVNTTVVGVSMMYYMLFVAGLITFFSVKTRRVGGMVTAAMGIADTAFLLVPVLSSVYFYDTWLIWAIAQSVANLILIGCMIREIGPASHGRRWGCVSMILLLLAFEVDVAATALGYWKGGVASRYMFVALFLMALFVVLRIIPGNINAAINARELEQEKVALKAQLAESRISTMVSQIRPHFIYNTLGSIEQLCELDPPRAGELVHSFSKYLRGNFGELDNPKPISIFREMEHVNHYVNVEKVRFPDMTFSFEMNAGDFGIPALTVQPIVENAIKHGLMKLPKGGTVRVVCYETDTHYCVTVEDDGVGFNTNEPRDERKHVGLRNIRERLKIMVDGTLDIESAEGVGTKVLITIPKEGKK